MVQLTDIIAARDVIAARLHRTPMTRSSYLGDLLGVDLVFKLEMFQKTGSFKPRGVLNNIHHLSDDEKRKGLISISSGNHAQAVAYAAGTLGVSATVVMPANATQSKIDATKAYGGDVILTEDDLLETMLRIQDERGLTFVHPFDSLDTIAGTGTTGLEILEDVPDADVVIVGIGGGGLISGVAAAVKQTKPDIKVIGVEPVGAPGMTLSLKDGKPAHLETIDTIADGLAAPFVGQHNLDHVQKYVDDVVLVTDDAMKDAIRLIMERCKVVAEPAAASTLAALLSAKIQPAPGAKVVCILSGGNIDRAVLKSIL